jgi:hypothetical protein
MDHLISVTGWNGYVYAALTDVLPLSSYKLIRINIILDLLTLPMMQKAEA